ncbi:GerMN domain-containing protein [Microbacterium sp. NIBRBAC000506063]|nr:GerMN domain-containing protein [Microbacterium sp. NIBRBAC000506063]
MFRRYSLQFFDVGWQHLVPDPRWFPRRGTIATTITQAVIAGAPSAWLADSVRTAFPDEVSLALGAVPVSAEDQVADVALTASALSLDPTTLGRMRLQLERSLAAAGVSGVRFTVDGRELDAELAEVVSNRIDPNTIVLTEDAFGVSVGDEVRVLPGVSAAILGIDAPIAAIDVSGDNLSAAVLVDGGAVYRVAEGGSNRWMPATASSLRRWTPAATPGRFRAISRRSFSPGRPTVSNTRCRRPGRTPPRSRTFDCRPTACASPRS